LTSCRTLIETLPDSLVQSTTTPPLHMGHRDDRGPISLAGPGPPSTLRRLWAARLGDWYLLTAERTDRTGQRQEVPGIVGRSRETLNTEEHAFWDVQAVQCRQRIRDVVVRSRMVDESCRRVEHRLQTTYQVGWDADRYCRSRVVRVPDPLHP